MGVGGCTCTRIHGIHTQTHASIYAHTHTHTHTHTHAQPATHPNPQHTLVTNSHAPYIVLPVPNISSMISTREPGFSPSYIHTYVCMHACMYGHIHIYLSLHAYMHTYIYTYIHTHMNTRKHTQSCYSPKHTQARHTCTNADTHAHTNCICARIFCGYMSVCDTYRRTHTNIRAHAHTQDLMHFQSILAKLSSSPAG